MDVLVDVFLVPDGDVLPSRDERTLGAPVREVARRSAVAIRGYGHLLADEDGDSALVAAAQADLLG